MVLVLAACGDEEVESETGTAAAAQSNRAPTISGLPPRSVVAGQVYAFTPTATDPDGDPIIFGVDGLPAWATFNTTTGLLTGTPQAADVGMHRGIVVWVSDGRSETLLPAVDVEVLPANTPPNRAPVISGTPPDAVIEGSAYDFLPIVSDADGDPLIFEIENRPDWASFDPATGRLSGTPDSGDVGTYVGIVIRVSDGTDAAVLGPFAISVNPLPAQNRAPVISGTADPDVVAGQAWSFQPQASDPDGNPLSFQVFGAPAWMSLNSSTGLLSGTPGPVAVGTHGGIQLIVSDGQASASLPAFAVTVLSTNRAPVIGGTPTTSVTKGQPYSFTPTASDLDGDSLTFTVTGLPAWATFNSTTGRISGTPAVTGTFSNIVITVSDGQASASLPSFSITVVNTPPVISGTPATSIAVGQFYSFTPTASDPNGDALTFTATGVPGWASFNSGTGRISGTPQSPGNFTNIVITARDGQAATSLPAFSIAVFVPNSPPVISGGHAAPSAGDRPAGLGHIQWHDGQDQRHPRRVLEHASLPAFAPSSIGSPPVAYSFTPTASDPNGDTLTFSVTGLPAWATFNGTTGRISGTPAVAGTFPSIVITVSDGQASASLPAFSITVVNTPPVISGTPPTSITKGQAYSFTPTASDANGDTLTFSVTGLPAWATFNGTTGRISGTAGTAGTFSNIVITVSDGQASASLPAFAIVVVNTPPVISGTPPTSIAVGQLYSFTPTASDPNGDALTFSVSGLPAWATFNGTTGRVSGTPQSAGTSANIVITVSDGQASASLPAFSIQAFVPNSPPVISGTPPAAVLVNATYSFTPTASDPNGDTLTFTATAIPGWASFNAATGAVTGTPQAAHVGLYSGISITVSDGTESATIGPFSIQVQSNATGSALLTWVPPTQNTDGTPLTNLAGFTVYWGTTPGNYPNSVRLTNPGLTTYLVENLLPGTTYYFVTTAFNGQNLESVFSNVASKTIP